MKLIDIVEQIEECAKLIVQNNPNKDILALIMIDSVYDMFVVDYFNNRESELMDSLEFYTYFNNKQTSEETTTGLGEISNKYWLEAKQKYDEFLSYKQHYENRLNYLTKDKFISKEECETTKSLHKFRNTFLHKSERKNLYLKPLVLLYYKLLNDLFIKLAEDSYSSFDNKCKYINNPEHISQNRHQNIIYSLNKKYGLGFDFNLTKKHLNDFLKNEVENLDNNVYYILDCLADKEFAINKLSNEFNLGKCSNFIYDGDKIHDCQFAKITKLKEKINKILSFKNFDKLLDAFSNLLKEITDLFNPIYKEACLIDQYIEQQAEIMRGK